VPVSTFNPIVKEPNSRESHKIAGSGEHHSLPAAQTGPLLLAGDDDPTQQISQNTRNAARDQGDQKRKPEPKSADAKEFCQAASDTGDHPISPRTAKFISPIRHSNLLTIILGMFVSIYS
jgi:hypothetical protein